MTIRGSRTICRRRDTSGTRAARMGNARMASQSYSWSLHAPPSTVTTALRTCKQARLNLLWYIASGMPPKLSTEKNKGQTRHGVPRVMAIVVGPHRIESMPTGFQQNARTPDEISEARSSRRVACQCCVHIFIRRCLYGAFHCVV